MYAQGRGISVKEIPGRQGALVPPDVIHGPVTYYLIEVMKISMKDRARYFKLAKMFIDEFLKESKFELMAAGFLEDVAKKQLLISHLWKLPSANRLWNVMNFLGTNDTYCDIDDLVSRTQFEIQDLAVGFGTRPVDELPREKTKSFSYVVADYHQWTNGLSGWDLEFDAGYDSFVQNNRGWIHLGNRMAITGKIYRLQQTWMVPVKDAARAKARLDASDWARAGYKPMRVVAFKPTSYDAKKGAPKPSTTKRTTKGRKKK